MDLLLAVGVWAVGAWLAYRCTRSASPHAREPGANPDGPREGSR